MHEYSSLYFVNPLSVLVFALILVELVLPAFNTLTKKEISLQLAKPTFGGIILIFTILTGLLAGSYHGLYLSSFNRVRVLKDTIRVEKSAFLPYQTLVVLQFSFSIALMIGAVIIYQQIQYGKDCLIGLDSKGLISVFSSADLVKTTTLFALSYWLQYIIICKSSCPPYQTWSNNRDREGSKSKDKSALFNTIASDFDYTKTVGIKLKTGRNFASDS